MLLLRGLVKDYCSLIRSGDRFLVSWEGWCACCQPPGTARRSGGMQSNNVLFSYQGWRKILLLLGGLVEATVWFQGGFMGHPEAKGLGGCRATNYCSLIRAGFLLSVVLLGSRDKKHVSVVNPEAPPARL